MSDEITRQQLKDEILAALRHVRGVDLKEADNEDMYVAVSTVMRDHLADAWVRTREDTLRTHTRAVGYLSAEYLLGTQLPNAVLNAGLTEQYEGALRDLGFEPRAVENVEIEPGLGNGGLGRLAACYMDSLTTQSVPAIGYGIRYTYGIFHQKWGADGSQKEEPDDWLKRGNPWEKPNYRREQRVFFGGSVVEENGKKAWKPAWSVRALPYDMLVPGFKSGRVNTLRLWSAKAVHEFDLTSFNQSRYDDAVKRQTAAENISKILYPEDSTQVGKRLRLEQQYFFSAASLADAISLFYPGQEHPDMRTFPDRIVFQLNDTHPVISIAELMRLLLDKYGYDWDTAFSITSRTFNYTCHTLLPEALEVWDAKLLSTLLPRHYQIIKRISDQAAAEEKKLGADDEKVERMRIAPTKGWASVRMAYLATYVGRHVNGVAKLHSQLLKKSVLKDFADVFPQKFTNVTNGVTPRRFLALANPELTALYSSKLGGNQDWLTHLDDMARLEKYADDPGFVEKFAQIRHDNKVTFSNWMKENQGVDVDPNTMFDTMIKRLHEYKRQSMKILQIIADYNALKSGRIRLEDYTPRTFVFGAKSAPGYAMAKLTIKLINNVARVVNNDSTLQGRMRVVFIENYNVTNAQLIIPATDLDEQISLAGEEASGTSNMKFAMNGALTVGTFDGANIEIRQRVGADNFFLFGMTVDQVNELKKHYVPRDYYEKDPDLKAAIDAIDAGTFSNGNKDTFKGFTSALLDTDRFMAFADFRSYMDVQPKIFKAYADRKSWMRKSILNSVRSGYFSSDRSVREYLANIWHTKALPEK